MRVQPRTAKVTTSARETLSMACLSFQHRVTASPSPRDKVVLCGGRQQQPGCLPVPVLVVTAGSCWGQTLLAARCHGLPSPALSTGIGGKSPAAGWPGRTGTVAGASAHPAAGGVLSNEPSSLGLCSEPKDRQCPQRLRGTGALMHRSSSQRACDRAQSPGKHRFLSILCDLYTPRAALH